MLVGLEEWGGREEERKEIGGTGLEEKMIKNPYPSKIFGSRKTSFACKGPQHPRGGSYETYGSEELSDNDDAGLSLSSVSHICPATSSSFSETAGVKKKQKKKTITYHGSRTSVRTNSITVYTHERIKSDRINRVRDVARHTEKKCNDHSKAKGPV